MGPACEYRLQVLARSQVLLRTVTLPHEEMVLLVARLVARVEEPVVFREVGDRHGRIGRGARERHGLASGYRNRVDVDDAGLVGGKEDLLLVGREGRSRDRGRREELFDRVLLRRTARRRGKNRRREDESEAREAETVGGDHRSLLVRGAILFCPSPRSSAPRPSARRSDAWH